jgi:hypothetical protein
MNFVLDEMAEVREYCSLIHKARAKAGFNSARYPITDVYVNRYFLPEHRELIAQECNIVGYMDIPPVQYSTVFPQDDYLTVVEGNRAVALSTVQSNWQQCMYNERLQQREEAEKRKKEALV